MRGSPCSGAHPDHDVDQQQYEDADGEIERPEPESVQAVSGWETSE